MAEIRFGLREGPGKGREVPFAADVYVHRRGGKFVKLILGVASLCASGDTHIFGWAETPKDTAGYSVWKSSSTAKADKVFVVYGNDNVFEMPVNETKASLGASFIGIGVAIVETGATYTLKQQAKLDSTAASMLNIVDIDKANRTVFVKIKPVYIQAT